MATFIDLFAGLGGFHKALKELGHTCAFASEIDSDLASLYKQNWGLDVAGDLREVLRDDINAIPSHDVLCAGFPCQPFSQAGKRLGRNDTDHGPLFDEIVKVLRFRKPQYFILENVPHIARHDNERTWEYIHSTLSSLGYQVDHHNYSPHEFGIPQHRTRIFVVGSLTGLEHFSFERVDSQKSALVPLADFLDKSPILGKSIPEINLEVIRLWQEFLDAVPEDVELPGHPIWAMEFGSTYPFDGVPPARLNATDLGRYKGMFGRSLKGLRKAQQLNFLPSYNHSPDSAPGCILPSFSDS